MGNTPDKMSKRKRPGPAGRKQEQTSPSPAGPKRSKAKPVFDDDEDDDIVVVETKKLSSKLNKLNVKGGGDAKPSTSSSSNSAGPSKSKLPVGPLKIKAMSKVGRPKQAKSHDTDSVEEKPRKQKKEKKEPLPPRISTKSGPRAEDSETGDSYKVQGLVRKWVGSSDQRANDEFYLVHFSGRPVPTGKGEDDEWVHKSQLKDCDDMIEKVDEEYLIEKEKRRKPKKPFYEYVSDDSDDEGRKAKKEEEIKGVEAAGKILRQRDSNLNFNEDGKYVKDAVPKKPREVVKKDPVGFDRGLPFEKIIAVTNYHGRLAYLIKFEGSTKCDLIPSHICKQKIPQQLCQYLDEHATPFEKVDEANLAPCALKQVKRAEKVAAAYFAKK